MYGVNIDGNALSFTGGRGRGRYTVGFLGRDNDLPPAAALVAGGCSASRLRILISHCSYVNHYYIFVFTLYGSR